MNTFTVNGKSYTARAFDFNTVCDLEEMGISMEHAGEKPMAMMRAYFALCTRRGKEYAGKEIEGHIAKGGTFEDVMEAMSDEMEKSDFFQNLNKKKEADAAENPEEEETAAE